ncbi:hypothetical protein SYNPS1DRAFT_27522 [Syncephalis pseudoplumigaleata]|uniref:Uncharacterized protein n=1 Tax=Syncephalis pseudoplumigaleata TaxID=1712513 RepID=A0A4P9Z2P3_9FUNG|nr:hypothetical protein SYNPS1DRAFT_27522 [Syncephalis pseudoplumigaleata]|eukprot:RKP26803.1 hypothetical protein SYNPS1DRAFT_27522 [Syncephalis pseudoplumigaleata]
MATADVTQVELWPEIVLSVLSGLLVAVSLVQFVHYRKRVYIVFFFLCCVNGLASFLRICPDGCSIVRLAIADFVGDLVPPLLLMLIGWLLSLWCTSAAAVLPRSWPQRIHKMFVALWISLFVSTLLCLVGHAQLYLMWSNAIEPRTGRSQEQSFAALRAFASILLPGVIILLVWALALVGINVALCRYCIYATQIYDPKGLVGKQWQLYILLISKICSFSMLWLRIVVVASTLCAIQDAKDYAQVMPLIVLAVTSGSGTDHNLFWINYCARIAVLIGLTGYLVPFGLMRRVDKPIVLRACRNGPRAPKHDANAACAPVQIVINGPDTSKHSGHQKESTAATSDDAFSCTLNKVAPVDTTLHTIIEYTDDEKGDENGEEEEECSHIEAVLEMANVAEPRARKKEAEKQQEPEADVSVIVVHRLEGIVPKGYASYSSAGNAGTDEDADGSGSYELSSSFSQALVEGRSRNTVLQVARHN